MYVSLIFVTVNFLAKVFDTITVENSKKTKIIENDWNIRESTQFFSLTPNMVFLL
jgi:hypothetical protein